MINNKLVYHDTLLSLSEVAKILNVSKSCLYHDIYNSKINHTQSLLPYVKLFGRVFYRSSDLQSMIDKAFNQPINKY